MIEKFFQNRELSWLRFNERVLEEAVEEHVPLLEKLKFVSIFVSNLDEFFMVRVGSLHDLSLLKKEARDNKTDMNANEQINAILEMLPPMYAKKDKIYKEITEKLRNYKIRNLKYEEANEEQKNFIDDFYLKNIDQLVSPQIVDLNHPFPFLENNKLYIICYLEKNGKNVFGIVPVRKSYVTYLLLPGQNTDYILMEDILLAQMENIFKGYKVISKNVFKATRNTDFTDDRDTIEEFDDYQAYMKNILKKRKRLDVVRVEAYGNLHKEVMDFLLKQLNIRREQVFQITSPLAMKYVFSLIDDIPKATQRELLYEPFIAYNPLGPGEEIIPAIRKKDRILSYPYESMESFLELLKEAANDSECRSIKITLYRLAKNSKVVRYLSEAAQNGKEVTVFVELKARFDEESNINYANILYEEGCNIIYGFNTYKIHSKICLITFRDKYGSLSYITQIGTGNYNESTAKQYTDFCFMTANPDIGLDATDFFKNMSMGNLNGKYKYLLQSPTSLKTGLMQHVDMEIAKGKDGYICCKFNSLTDKEFIEKFVEASQKGCKVDLIIRGISCLVPGIKGYSENIRIKSIVGRFLEHPRVYIFGKENHHIYISSADLMTRNTEKRVEIATPILDEKIKKIILSYIDVQLKDNVGGRLMDSSGEYQKLDTEDEKISSQQYFIEEAERKEKVKQGNNPKKDKNIIVEREEANKTGFFEKLKNLFR